MPCLSLTCPLALTTLVLSEANSSSVIRSSPSAAVGKQPDKPSNPAGPLATEEHEQQGRAFSKKTPQATPDPNSRSEQLAENLSTKASAQGLKKTTATAQASQHHTANVHDTAGHESEAEAEEEKEEDKDDAAGSGAKVGKADACGSGGHASHCSGVPTAVETEASFLLQLISCPIIKVSLNSMHVCRIGCLC